jgi:hypothetical protein
MVATAECIPGYLFHLYHGSLDDRNYLGRYKILKDWDFDPNNDLKVESGGGLEWATLKPNLHQAVYKYFVNRDEDKPHSGFIKKILSKIYHFLRGLKR